MIKTVGATFLVVCGRYMARTPRLVILTIYILYGVGPASFLLYKVINASS